MVREVDTEDTIGVIGPENGVERRVAEMAEEMQLAMLDKDVPVVNLQKVIA